jgi:exodeoxyribonuclease VII large subunit
MNRKVTSQWDFGELFPPEASRRVFTVTELTAKVRRLLEDQVGSIWITGEVTNLRVQGSGHIYFTLKDANAQLNCVLFRGEPVAHRELLQDGQKLLLQGDLTVYELRGQYQLLVRSVELQGVGALQLAFERLKQKLQAEGLFATERKRPIPRYAHRIGLATSPTGAAIRDVLHVIQRRHPGLEVVMAPCRVQGDGAAATIASAIRLLNEWHCAQTGLPPEWAQPLDLILVTRGGGSLEDLWAFNEEVVARAIFESALPVVSAVGHEIDFTISDFVADLRAATPSAAAELITEGAFASRTFVAEAARRLGQRTRRRLTDFREEVDYLRGRLVRLHPRSVLNERLQYVDELQVSLVRRAKQGCREQRAAWENLRQRLSRLKPALVLAQRGEAVRQLLRRLYEQARHGCENLRNALARHEARLRLLSPENVLARGYSITFDAETGKVVRAAEDVRRGQRLRSKLQRGEVRSVAE